MLVETDLVHFGEVEAATSKCPPFSTRFHALVLSNRGKAFTHVESGLVVMENGLVNYLHRQMLIRYQ